MKRNFLLKKFALAVALFSSVATLSSCSVFFDGDEYSITNTEVNTDANGNTIVTVNFSGEDIEPLTFTIPASTKGISSITSEVKDNQVVLTINFNDGTNQQIGVPIINGKDGVGITDVELIEQADGSKFIRFHYSDGTSSEEFPLPSGKDGASIKEITPEVNEDGSITYTISFTDGREDFKFTVQNGVSIVSMYLDEEASILDEDYYYFKVEYSDGRLDTIRVEKPKTNNWLSGVGSPSNELGDSQDFYIDLNSGWVYQKSTDKGWTALFSIKGEGYDEPSYFMVGFHFLDGEYINNFGDQNKLEGPTVYYISAKEGECIPSDNIPVPKKDGFIFEGWYKDPDSPISGKFTDMTIVNSKLDLYARWSSL